MAAFCRWHDFLAFWLHLAHAGYRGQILQTIVFYVFQSAQPRKDCRLQTAMTSIGVSTSSPLRRLMQLLPFSWLLRSVPCSPSRSMLHSSGRSYGLLCSSLRVSDRSSLARSVGKCYSLALCPPESLCGECNCVPNTVLLQWPQWLWWFRSYSFPSPSALIDRYQRFYRWMDFAYSFTLGPLSAATSVLLRYFALLLCSLSRCDRIATPCLAIL